MIYSSISQKIGSSPEVIKFFANNFQEIKQKGSIPDQKMEFHQTSDLYNSLHGANAKNIRMDKQGNLSMTVEDLWNFDQGRTSVKGRIGEKLQKEGSLEPFYIITEVKIPYSQWKEYKAK